MCLSPARHRLPAQGLRSDCLSCILFLPSSSYRRPDVYKSQGYATRYGDGAGDFSPLSKRTVQEVKEIGRQLGLPSLFVDKTPIDGLQSKTDEEN